MFPGPFWGSDSSGDKNNELPADGRSGGPLANDPFRESPSTYDETARSCGIWVLDNHSRMGLLESSPWRRVLRSRSLGIRGLAAKIVVFCPVAIGSPDPKSRPRPMPGPSLPVDIKRPPPTRKTTSPATGRRAPPPAAPADALHAKEALGERSPTRIKRGEQQCPAR